MKPTTSKKTDFLSRKSFANRERFWVKSYGTPLALTLKGGKTEGHLSLFAINLVDCMRAFRVDQLPRLGCGRTNTWLLCDQSIFEIHSQGFSPTETYDVSQEGDDILGVLETRLTHIELIYFFPNELFRIIRGVPSLEEEVIKYNIMHVAINYCFQGEWFGGR